jgi:hypothetical protein
MDNNKDSINLIFSVTKDALAIQQEQKVSLENKANMLVVFAGGILALLMNAWETLLNFPVIGQQIVLISVGFFAVSVLLAFVVAWVHKYRMDPNPYELAEEFLNKTELDTQLQLISNWRATWKFNMEIIERNSLILRIAFGFQVVAFLQLGLAFAISIFSA